ncbi:hypothetical protein OAS39_11100 [Pirellulales bacterium]|nr:hypothetical protein [Pirellulales bacterium]
MIIDTKPPGLRFTVASLLVVTAALAVTLAIGLSPPPDLEPWETDMRWQQALLCGGGVLVICELVRQSSVLLRQSAVVDSQIKFPVHVAMAIRLILAFLVAAAVTSRVLVKPAAAAEFVRGEMSHVYIEFWPDLMMTISILLAVRTLLIPRCEIRVTSTRKLLSGSIIIASLLAILLFMVTDRAQLVALVHFATDGVEKWQAVGLQRAGKFPSHIHEGFRTFWMSTSAALTIVLAAGLLCVHAAVQRPWIRTLASISFFLLLLIAVMHCCWFVWQEFPRVSPDLASVATPRLWSDSITGMMLLIGLSALFGWKLARRRVLDHSVLVNLPTTPPTGVLAVCVLAVASGWQANVLLCRWTVDHSPNSLLSFFFWYLPLRSWSNWQNFIGTFAAAILQPELLLTLILFTSTLILLRQTARRPIGAATFHPVRARHMVGYSLAALALMVVALPSLAVFSFCYWLGPFVH